MLEQGYNGVKTGVTNNAGPCLCTYYNHNGTEIVIAILRSRSMNHRWVEIPKLNSWAIQHLDNFN